MKWADAWAQLVMDQARAAIERKTGYKFSDSEWRQYLIDCKAITK